MIKDIADAVVFLAKELFTFIAVMAALISLCLIPCFIWAGVMSLILWCIK